MTPAVRLTEDAINALEKALVALWLLNLEAQHTLSPSGVERINTLTKQVQEQLETIKCL